MRYVCMHKYFKAEDCSSDSLSRMQHQCPTSILPSGNKKHCAFFLGNDEGPGFKRNELQPMFYVTHQCCIYQSRSFPSLEVLQQPTSSMEPSGNSASTYSLPCETLCFLSTWGFLVSNQAPEGETSRMEGMARCPCPLVQAALG